MIREKANMNWTQEKILDILDQCAKNSTFPMLDNGYVYPAATRLSVFRSDEDWAIVIEVFGFSPRTGDPDLHISTFANKLRNRNTAEDYVSRTAYENYLKNNPNNESLFVFPIENDEWLNEADREYTRPDGICILRGEPITLPAAAAYERHDIELEEDVPLTFEFCRYLAAKYRDKVLATATELRTNIPSDLSLFLQLDQWNHPDIADDQLPSQSETFIQIAEAIVTGHKTAYQPTLPPNTHWSHWPMGGTL